MKTVVDLVTALKTYFLGKDTAAKQAVEANIAPVEADPSSASRAYVVGEQLFLNDVLYDVTSPISVGDAIAVDTNITAANKLSADIQTLTNQVTDISAVMGKNGAKNKEPFDIDVVKALNTTGTWTGNSYALNGITFAFADDGKVTVSGTASALCSINISGNYDLNGDYIITGCPSGGGISTYSLRIYDSSATAIADDIGEGISFTANNLANCRTNIIVRKDAAISTPIVFAPMIRDSKDPDATYQPYAKTNQELTAENQTLTNYVNNGIYYDGAKNLLPLLISKIKAINTTGSWSKSDENDVYTISGVTYTITSNANGVITNIKASGTGASSSPFSDLYITLRNTYDAFAMYELIKNNTLTVATHAVNSVNFILDGQYNDSWKTVQAISGKADITLNISTSNNVQICIRIVAGRTVTNEDITPIMAQKSLMDIDDSFSLYAKTNHQLTQDSVTWDDLSEVGAVNLLPNNATTQTISGITFTVNDNRSITFSGTASSNTYLTISTFMLSAGTYKLNGANGGVQYKVDIQLIAGGNLLASDYSDGATFTLASDTAITARIRVESGYAISGSLTFKPMITVASYNGPYVPYAKTNKELTDDVYGHNLNKYYIYDYADTTLFNAALKTKTLDQIVVKLAAPARICICTGSADLTSTLALDLIDKGLLDSTSNMFWLEISKLGDYQNRAYARCTYLYGWATAVEKIAFVNNGTWQASKTLTN